MRSWHKIVIISFLLLTPFLTSAQDSQTPYKLLEPIPVGEGGASPAEVTASQYIKGLFILTIAVAGALAVITIIIGGIQYMSTDAFQGKSDAKVTIGNAIWGLALALSAYLILYSIDESLVNFDLRLERVEIEDRQLGTSTPATSGRNGGARSVAMENCSDCVPISVPHKPSGAGVGFGCNSPTGVCMINRELNSRLESLNSITTFRVTESFPPTVTHEADCHYNGTCVDATIANQTNPQNIRLFIEEAQRHGLRAVFEVSNITQANSIRNASGLTNQQVKVVPGVSPHFSVYMN